MEVEDRAIDRGEDSPISDGKAQCRICYSAENPINNLCDLVSPCACKGTMKYVHRSCLRMWRFRGKRLEEIRRCEQCLTFYTVDDEIVPHGVLVKITSVFSLCIVYFGVQFVANLLLEAMFIVTEDLSSTDTSRAFRVVQKGAGAGRPFPGGLAERRVAHLGFPGTVVVVSVGVPDSAEEEPAVHPELPLHTVAHRILQLCS